MPRRKRDPESDIGGRERLLAAAVRLFGAKGYAATTVRDILRAAGVTAPVLYYHFGNKEGLWTALVREGVSKLSVAQDEAMAAAGSAVDRIRGFCRAAYEMRRQHADSHRVIWEILSGPPAAAPRLDLSGEGARFIERLRALVQEAVSSGELRACNTLHVTLALTACLDAASGLRVYDLPGSDPGDELEGMMSVILDGLVIPFE